MPLWNGYGGFPSRSAADWSACTMSLYIGASRRLIGTRAPIYRRVTCNELRASPPYGLYAQRH